MERLQYHNYLECNLDGSVVDEKEYIMRGKVYFQRG